KEVLVPTWSEKNGQDDIVWHKASKQTDGSYKVHIETSQHKYDSGKYQVHVHYVTGSNQRTYVTETTVGIPQAPVVQKTGQVSTSNVSSTGFDVIVKNVNHPSGVKEVLVPTWSEKNGQDDIVWHKASKQTDGSYKVHIETSQHKYDSGKYQVHVHYVTGSNQRTYVTETTVGIPQAPVVQKTGQVSTSNVSSTGFDVVVKNVNHPAGVKEVLVPTWSEKNGQDDIVWHKASKQTDGSYKVHIETSQHKYDSGKYQVHVHYVTGSNQRTYVTETIVQIPQSQKSIHVENANDTGFDVRITNLNKFTNVREVLVPTWTSHNGQDDLIWHKASRQADGSYKARIEYSRHNYEYGMYTIHSYVKDATGQLKWLDSTSFDAPKPANVGKGYPEKWVGTKKYSGVVTHIDSNPVYSDQNRVTIDRIVIHHNAGMSDEGARATWYIRNGNETSAHYQVTPDKIWGVVPENEVAWHAGHYPTNQRSIGIEHLNNSLGPEWTIAEETYRNSAKLIADISLRYNIPLDRDHVIGHDEVSATLCPGGIDIDKLLSMAKAERTQLENVAIPKTSPAPAPQTPQKLEVPYYSQLDSRWANKRYGNYLFGPTGCVPTTLAMAFTGLSGKTVLPTEVGDYIYKNTDAFNKIGPGTAATGIAKAVSHWGYKSEVLKTKQAIQASLELGNPVLLAVGPSVFVNYPSTHELLLTEYKDGKVKLSDPYTKSLSGWHSLDYLWNVRSHNSYDNALGSPAIAVKRA
ncbi:GBS Bsp-like repeat-containing protein, partial [Streptococcus sp. 10F2]